MSLRKMIAASASMVASIVLGTILAVLPVAAVATTWNYDFGTTTGTSTFTTPSGTSSSFLPAPASGGGSQYVRVGSGGGGFTLANPGDPSLGFDAELTITAPTGASANKFAISNYTSTNFYSLSFSTIISGSVGTFYALLGNGSSFDSTGSTISGTQTAAGLRFQLGTSATTTYRSGASWVSPGLTTSGIVKDAALTLSIYGNNSASSTSYYVSGSTYSLGSNTYDIWLGNTKISGSALTAGQLATGAGVDSFMFYGENSTGNVGKLSLDNIVYANELPTAPLDPVYWAPQAGGGGSGTWTTAGTTWATAAGTQGSLTQGSGTLIFGDAVGTVTVGDSVSASAGLQIATNGYLLTGGTISLTGATSGSNTITVNSSVSGTIDAVLGGSAGMTKAGAGTLALGGANSLTGNFAVTAGTLATTTSNVITDAASVDVSSSALLRLGGNETVAAVVGSGTVDVQANTLTADTTVAGTFAGVIQGTGGVTKSGAATFTLSGNNAYSGATTVAAGTLATSAADRIGNSSDVTVASGATLQLGGVETVGSIAGAGGVSIGGNAFTAGGSGASTSFSGVISGAGGSFTKAGAGALTFTGSNTYTGATTVTGGTLAISGAGSVASASIVLGSGATLDVVTVTSGFTLANGKTLSGVGAVAGGMTLGNGSTVAPGSSAGAVGTLTTGNLVLAGGATYAFNLADATTTAGAGWDLLSSGTVTLPGSPFTIDVSGAATGFSPAVSQSWKILAAQSLDGTFDTANFSIVLSSFPSLGGGSLAITNSGTDGTGLYLAFTAVANLQWLGGVGGSGTWTAAGGTNWSGGAWDPAQPGVFAGTPGTVTVEDVAAEKGLSFDAGGYVLSGGTLSLTGTSLTANTLSTVTGTTTIDSVLAGSVGMLKSGAGTLALGGASTLSGLIDVEAGTLATTTAGAIADGADVEVAAGAVVALGGSETIGSLAGSGTVSLGANTLTTGGNGASTTLAGIVEGTGGLTKSGTGTFTLAGANTYTGATTVIGGTLATASANRIADASAVTVGAAGTLTLGGNETIASLAGAGEVALGSNTLTTGDGSTTTFSGGVSGSGGITKVGAGTFTLAGNNTYGGTTRVEAGTLALGANDALSGSTAVQVAGGTFDLAAFTDTVASLTLSAGAVTGSGTLTATTYTLSGGAVSGNLGAGSLSTAGNASLVGTAAATTIDLVSGTLSLGSAGRLTGAPALTGSSGAVLALGGNESFGSLAGASTMALGAATLTVDTAVSTTFSGILSGSSGGFVKAGVGTLTLNNTANTVGTITVTGGTLATAGFSMIDNAANVTITAPGTLAVGNSDGIGSIAGSGGLVIVAGTVAVGGNNASTTFGGVASGAGGLTKIGSGTFTLGGANTYAGATRSNVGTLSLGAADVLPNTTDLFIASGAAIDMAGFSDTVNTFTNNGGVISGSGSTLTAGTYTLAGGTTSVDLGAGTLVGGGNARLVGTSAATLVNANSGTLTLDAAGRLTATPTIGGLSAGRIVLGGNETVAGLTGAPRIEIGSGTLTVNAVGSSTHSGLVSGAGGIVKQGAGTLALGGGNTYAGPTVVSAGTLATTGAAGVSADVTIASGATLALGGNQTVSTLAGTGLVSINTGTLTMDTASTSTVSTLFSGAGGLDKAGTGEVIVDGNNGGYTGPVSVMAGGLKAATSTALGTGTVALRGGSLTAASGLTITNDVRFGFSGPATFYSQNFNSIGSGLPTGWTTGTGATATVLGTTVAFTTTPVDWSNTNPAFKNYAAATGLSGTATTGEQSASLDRALGVRPSGSFGDPGAAFSYAFSTTGKTLDSLSIDMMLLSAEGRTTDWSIQYGLGASPSSFTTLGTWTTPSAFGTTTLTFSGTAVAGLSNQTDAVFRVVALNASTGSNNRDSIGIDNFRIDTFETIASAAMIGASEAGGVEFTGNVDMILTSTATLTAVTGGTATFSGAITGGSGAVVKTGAGLVVLSGSSSYGGTTAVSSGTLRILDTGKLAGTSGVTVAGGSRLQLLGEIGGSGSATPVTVDGLLGGDGRVFGTLGGSGSIAPGNSPGILTANAVDPSSGIDHDFEFTSLNPDYTTSGTGALNDILHLTAATPFTTALSGSAGNTVNVYFKAGSFSEGQTFDGGFFADSAVSASALLGDVSGAQFNYFVASLGGGTVYEGTAYLSLADWNTANAQALSVEVGARSVANAGFETGATNGYVTTFAVVPEPSTLALAGLGLLGVAGLCARKRWQSARRMFPPFPAKKL